MSLISTETIEIYGRTLTIETYEITSREQWLALKAMDVSSTEVSALFDANPYTTHYELWHNKFAETISEIEENERMMFGTELEPVIAKLISRKNGWEIAPKKVYKRIVELRMGSSFDFEIISHPSFEGTGTLEIKNVDSMIYHKKWEENEAPAHIEFQGQHQLVFNPNYLVFGMFVGGNKLREIVRTPQQDIIEAIFVEVEKFWASIAASKPPPPNLERDAGFIIDMYSLVSPGKVADVSDAPEVELLVNQYFAAMETEKAAVKQKQACKAQLLMLIGDHEKAIGRGYNISAGMIGPKSISYQRDGYRDFRINKKTPKKEKK